MTEKFFQYKDKILHEIKYNENLNEIGYQSEIKNLEYFIEQNSKSDINENKDNEEQETLEAQKNKYLKAQEVLDKREMVNINYFIPLIGKNFRENKRHG